MPIWTSVVTGSLHRQGAVPASLGADVHQEDRAGWGRYHVVWGDIGGNVALYGMMEAIPKMSSVLLGNKCFRKDEVETKSWILSCEKGQLFVLRFLGFLRLRLEEVRNGRANRLLRGGLPDAGMDGNQCFHQTSASRHLWKHLWNTAGAEPHLDDASQLRHLLKWQRLVKSSQKHHPWK